MIYEMPIFFCTSYSFIKAIELNASLLRQFLFLVFTSITIENMRSTLAEWGNVR